MKQILLFIGILLIHYHADAQEKSLTIQFSSDENVPPYSFDQSKKTYRFTSTDKISQTFNHYTIVSIIKKFPTVYREKHPKAAALNRVYLIRISGDINKLFGELADIKSDRISALYIAPSPQTLVTPDDYAANFTYPYCTFTANTGLQLDLINAKNAWDITEGNASTIIGIVDAGFDSTHEDIANKYLTSPAYLEVASSVNDHALSVAGIAGAETNNNKGYASIGNKCSIKFFDWGYEGILLAAQNGSKVINLSWTDGTCASYEDNQDAIDLVYDTYHVTIVAAAGNGTLSDPGQHCGTEGNDYVYPASYNHVISVSTVGHIFDPQTYPLACYGTIGGCSSTAMGYNWKDYHNKFSNSHSACTGLVTNGTMTHNDKVAVCAPGIEVPVLKYGNAYQNLGFGTSYSSPMVTGTAALMLTVNSSLTGDDVNAILRCTARDLYEIWDNTYYLNLLGSGRIDAGKAVALAQTWIPGTGFVQGSAPTDIKWYDILSDDITTVEEEVTCKSTTNPGKCNIGYRLEATGGSDQKWLIYYTENDVSIYSSVKYGSSVVITRGVDYPVTNNSNGKLYIAVRSNGCVPSNYYFEEKEASCFDADCTHSCDADITITGTYSKAITESSTWIKSSGQTDIDNAASVKLDAEPTSGYVEFSPSSSSDYFVAAPSTNIAVFAAQALDGCDPGVVSRPDIAQQEPKNEAADITGISVFPNPAKGTFNIIYGEDHKNSTFQLFDMNGKLQNILFRTKGAKRIQADCSRLSQGIYFLKISGKNKTEVRKLVLL